MRGPMLLITPTLALGGCAHPQQLAMVEVPGATPPPHAVRPATTADSDAAVAAERAELLAFAADLGLGFVDAAFAVAY
jgi:hypothetical protein